MRFSALLIFFYGKHPCMWTNIFRNFITRNITNTYKLNVKRLKHIGLYCIWNKLPVLNITIQNIRLCPVFYFLYSFSTFYVLFFYIFLIIIDLMYTCFIIWQIVIILIIKLYIVQLLVNISQNVYNLN